MARLILGRVRGQDGKDCTEQLPISDSVISPDSGVAASSKAVKTAYDLALAAQGAIPPLTDAVNSSSKTTAASALAVKTAYDKAVAAAPSTATMAERGIARQATDAEAKSGVTGGGGPAFMTPETSLAMLARTSRTYYSGDLYTDIVPDMLFNMPYWLAPSITGLPEASYGWMYKVPTSNSPQYCIYFITTNGATYFRFYSNGWGSWMRVSASDAFPSGTTTTLSLETQTNYTAPSNGIFHAEGTGTSTAASLLLTATTSGGRRRVQSAFVSGNGAWGGCELWVAKGDVCTPYYGNMNSIAIYFTKSQGD